MVISLFCALSQPDKARRDYGGCAASHRPRRADSPPEAVLNGLENTPSVPASLGTGGRIGAAEPTLTGLKIGQGRESTDQRDSKLSVVTATPRRRARGQ